MSEIPRNLAIIVIVALALIGILSIAGFALARFGSFTNSIPAQTASASTDYFSWSCQQLKARVNQDLNDPTNQFHYPTESQTLTGIMQLKGCSA